MSYKKHHRKTLQKNTMNKLINSKSFIIIFLLSFTNISWALPNHPQPIAGKCKSAFAKKSNNTTYSDSQKQTILEEAGFSISEITMLTRGTISDKTNPIQNIILRRKKIVTLDIPQKDSVESDLKERGYSSVYTKGMDVIQELMAVAKQLRAKKIHPYRDHVPYLGDKLREYTAFMELGVKNSKQQAQFDSLKKYVEIIIQEEGVTYAKWLIISLKLPDILSEYNSYIDTDKLMELFPKIITMPTILGLIGLIPINTMRSEGVEPIALVNGPTFVDGKKLEPASVSRHDDSHIYFSDKVVKSFYIKWIKRRDSVPVKKGQNVELAYHILTHETFSNSSEGAKRTAFTEHTLEKIEDHLRHGLHELYRSSESVEAIKEMIDFSGPYNPKKHPNVQLVVDDFMEVFNDIQRKSLTRFLSGR